MTTTRNGVGRNRGFEFTLLIESRGAGAKLCIRSPLGHLITIPLSPGELQAIIFLLEVFKLDVVSPNIASEHKGRRQVDTIAKAIHKTVNYISKNAGKLNRAILKAAWSDDKFVREASLLPELFCVIKKGSNRGHRLNVDVAIEYLGKPPDAPNASATPPDSSPPSPDNSNAAGANANGDDLPSPNGKITPSKLVRVSEIPPPLVRPAQIEEKSWSGDASVRTNDRNRDDNSGHTPA